MPIGALHCARRVQSTCNWGFGGGVVSPKWVCKATSLKHIPAFQIDLNRGCVSQFFQWEITETVPFLINWFFFFGNWKNKHFLAEKLVGGARGPTMTPGSVGPGKDYQKVWIKHEAKMICMEIVKIFLCENRFSLVALVVVILAWWEYSCRCMFACCTRELTVVKFIVIQQVSRFLLSTSWILDIINKKILVLLL